VSFKEDDYDADTDVLKQIMILNPEEYKKIENKEEELNEMRHIAGLSRKKIYTNVDEEIRHLLDIARI
jgi:hypothetical protein